MRDLSSIFASPGRTRLAGVPEGYDSRLIADLAAAGAVEAVLYVARDEERMVRMADGLGFFAPALDPVQFPAWDCLPYDRSSPHPDVLARRVAALGRLADADVRPRVVLTTINALIQRVPPPETFRGASLAVRVGERLDLAQLNAFLDGNGYARADTVMEPGEYAIRGGIVDLFPPGAEEPLRLDLFGDDVEGIRCFDPLSQRTTGKLDGFSLGPVNELVLTPAAIERFRSRYRDLFGPVGGDDPLYESISAGRRHSGMEHWIALFHERMATLFDYLPERLAVLLDDRFDEALGTRLETIADHYGARLSMLGQHSAASGAPYRPAPPELLYLDADGWRETAQDRAVAELSRFGDDGREGTVDAGGRRGFDFSAVRADPGGRLYAEVGARVDAEWAAGRRTVVAAYGRGSRDRLIHLLAEQGFTRIVPVDDWAGAEALEPGHAGAAILDLESGFAAPGIAVVTEQDILGERMTRRPRRRRRAEQFLTEATDIAEGDLVVHVDHGIGRYEGLETLTVGGAPHDCLRLLYDGGAKLYVPVENIEVLSRYGSEDSGVQLDRLGGVQWQARKARLKERVREMAQQLIAVAAERLLADGDSVRPPDGAWDEFCARFPYPETEDQLRAIEDVVDDLSSGRPMDRLVCGDVGFGKTEVALRAAFVAVMAGMQVAVVVPTTLLARQHYQTFTERFRGLPVRIGRLSRLVKGKEAKGVKDELTAGTLDIVIGTHALLAKSIRFDRLGLLVVDEEQHFGVAHKERLKGLKAGVHVLTLTATPIPRTLQMALSGVRELSIIASPPVDRLAVRTFVTEYDPLVVREAIARERFRGGQCFYVCPRVKDLPEVAERVRELVPDARVAVAHGGMSPNELEDVMGGFYDGAFDVLVSTNIVESGLDIPTANTLIVHRADMFGLAQLYQLRGRIGRGKVRGYAYLTLPQNRLLTRAAQKRLDVMQALDTLGAGFTLASHDLDIRGAGNLLGEEQSGHIREVGIELYQHMLEQAVAEARSGRGAETEAEETWSPQINIGMPVLIPESYVAELNVRLALYRRLSALEEQRDIDGFAAELVDRFGPLPPEVDNLLRIVAIKRLCRLAGVEKIDAGPKGAVVSFHRDRFADPAGLVDFIQRQQGTARLRPDHKLVLQRAWDAPDTRLRGVARLVDGLSRIATGAEAA